MQTAATAAPLPSMRISKPGDAQHHTAYLNQININELFALLTFRGHTLNAMI